MTETTETKIISNEQSDDQQNVANLNKLAAIKKMRELTKGSKWTLLQQILQEIVATFIVEGKKRPSYEKLVELLKQEVELRYKNDEELKKILLDAIPARQNLAKWFDIKGWDDAVWDKIKLSGLFTAERRTRVINALYQRVIEKGDTTAAKIWLTMSGDYSDKIDINKDPIADKFREINSILHTNKKENSD